ncbi:MAG: hypothetical protein ACHQDF_07205 [Chitinophagales bacterium]
MSKFRLCLPKPQRPGAAADSRQALAAIPAKASAKAGMPFLR